MMKKDMNKFNESNITEDSINKSNFIISNMEGSSFHNHYHLLYDICNTLDKTEITYMEIGTFAGGSASLVSLNEKVCKIYSIDIGNPINKEIPIRNVNKFKHGNCVYEYIQGNSTNKSTINYIKEKISNVDLLFIDGSHSYDDVISDFTNYKDLVSVGGYIIFDDYLDITHSPDVYYAVNDIVKNLNKLEYDVIGSLKYDLLKKTNIPNLFSSNEFILLKIK